MAYRGVNACHCWVNFNGTGTLAVNDSHNVSSVTDNGTGQYTVNFSTNHTTSNYAVSWGGDGGTGSLSDGCQIFSLTTSSFGSHWGNGGSQHDFSNCYFMTCGDC
tara:strand:+ start:111 stop:425 length:315 start_codon:yes stop_codon:yes gene_type:complete